MLTIFFLPSLTIGMKIFGPRLNYDLAHMWVSDTKTFAGPENQNITGIASVGSLCSNQGYGITQIRHSFFSKLTTAHEIGHNLGATHPNQEDPPVNACLGTVMQSIQNDAASLTFCNFSKNQIRNHISRNNQCLDPTTISTVLQPPYDLKAQVLGPNRIRVWWKDHNGNRATGFRVERSPDGAVPPEAVGWVPAERWDFIDGDLTPHRKYDYRVRAYNDEEMSEPSNVVYASTPAVPQPQFDTPAISTHWVIPTTVHAGGRYGGTFKTKVGLAARTDEVRITARLYGPKGFQQERPIILNSNTYWILDDFFLQVFKKKGSGAVELIAPKPFHLVAVEVYIDTANGRNITPVINETSPLVPYQGLAYNYGVTVNDATRVNLGIFNSSDVDQTIRVQVWSGVSGEGPLETITFNLPAKGWEQKSLSAKVENGYLAWAIPEEAYPYLVSVDNTSNDGTLVYPARGE